MHNPNYIPKTYAPVPGEALGSTFKSVCFDIVIAGRRKIFWVSNRYLRQDTSDDRFYMPATMVDKINKDYQVTGTVTRKLNRAFCKDSKL